MPEQDSRACELNHAEEVVDVIFPPGDEASGVMQPGEETFDLPAPLRAPQGPPILRASAVLPMGGDHLDAVPRAEHPVERVAVVPAIPDQPRRELSEEAGVEGGGDEMAFIRRSAGHVHGERKTMAVADRHDLAPFTTAGRANGSAPFFAPANVASTKASVRSIFPRSRRSSASRWSSRSRRPLRCHS